MKTAILIVVASVHFTGSYFNQSELSSVLSQFEGKINRLRAKTRSTLLRFMFLDSRRTSLPQGTWMPNHQNKIQKIRWRLIWSKPMRHEASQWKMFKVMVHNILKQIVINTNTLQIKTIVYVILLGHGSG